VQCWYLRNGYDEKNFEKFGYELESAEINAMLVFRQRRTHKQLQERFQRDLSNVLLRGKEVERRVARIYGIQVPVLHEVTYISAMTRARVRSSGAMHTRARPVCLAVVAHHVAAAGAAGAGAILLHLQVGSPVLFALRAR